MVVDRRWYRCWAVRFARRMMVILGCLPASLSLTCRTYGWFAACYECFRSGFTTYAFLVLADAPRSRGFTLIRADRITLWWFPGHLHGPCIEGFKRQHTCVSQAVQLIEIGQKPNLCVVCVGNALATKFLDCRGIAGFEIPLDTSPILRKLARFARVTYRDLA